MNVVLAVDMSQLLLDFFFLKIVAEQQTSNGCISCHLYAPAAADFFKKKLWPSCERPMHVSCSIYMSQPLPVLFFFKSWLGHARTMNVLLAVYMSQPLPVSF